MRTSADLRAWATGKELSAFRWFPHDAGVLRSDELVGEALILFDRLVPLFAAAVEDDPLRILGRRAGTPDGGRAFDRGAFRAVTHLSDVWLSRALDLLDAIGTVENARPYLVDAVSRGEKIMGFGHRVYKTYDPRARVLRETAHEINAPLADYAEAVEETIIQTFDELKPGRSISTNVEYWSAVVMDAAGLPPELFTPTFVVSRMVGWTAHINEQLANNRIFRPRASYIGPALRSVSDAV